MALRTLEVRLVASVHEFQAAMGAAAATVTTVGREISVTSAKSQRDLRALGQAGVALGAAMVAATGLSAKAAIGFESSFASVKRTVGGTNAQLAQMRDGIRDLARHLPASANEIAGVAASAGQLGVQRDSILAFTRTMVDLGSVTDLSAEQAGVSLAQLMNIMKTAPNNVDRLGSTLTALGLVGASTESQILEMSNRLAGAGKQAGLTESDVLAFANALTSMGLDAEAGGNAFARVMIIMRDAVLDGGDKLKVFADTAGMTGEQFAEAFHKNGAQAIVSFVDGLGRMTKAGASTTGVLDALGLSDIRVGDALRRTAGNSDVLRQSLDVGSQAWKDNTALTNAANARYETTASQLKILRNNVVDLAISFGDTLLPAVKGAASGSEDLLAGVREMPGPLKAAGAVSVTTLGTIAALGGGFILFGERIAKARVALTGLAESAPLLTAGLGYVAAASAGVVIGLGLASVAMGKAKKEASDLIATLNTRVDLKSTSSIESQMADIRGRLAELDGSFSGLGDRVKNTAVGFLQAATAGTVFGNSVTSNRETVAALAKRYEELGVRNAFLKTNLMGLTSEFGLSEEAVMALADKAGIDLTKAWGEVIGPMRKAHDEIGAGINQADAASMSYEDMQAVLDKLRERAEALSKAISGFTDPVQAYMNLLQRKQEEEKKAAQVTADSTKSGADSWETYARTVSVSMGDYITELEKQVTAQNEWRQNLVTIAKRGGAELAEELAALGPEGAQQVAAFASATDDEFRKASMLWVASTHQGGQDLQKELAVMAEIAKHGYVETAKGIADAVGVPLNDVIAIAERYGVTLAGVVNPALEAVGKPPISLRDRGIVHLFAGGGVEEHVAQITPAGGPIRVFAEPETGGEAYIPMAAPKRGRSTRILGEVAERFGYALVPMADGGVVPGVPNVDRYGSYAGPFAAGAMTMERDGVAGFLAQSARAGGSSKPVTTAAATTATTTGATAPAAPGSVSGNVAVGKQLAAGRGWGSGPAWDALYTLLQHESGWSTTATNPRGGNPATSAYGIPQALPGRRMASKGADWVTNPATQIAWGLDYIGGRYHSPQAAWAWWQRTDPRPFPGHWYAEGGILNPHVRDRGGPLLPGFTLNATGRPETVVSFASGGVFEPGAAQAAAGLFGRSSSGLQQALSDLDRLQQGWQDAARAMDEAAQRGDLLARQQEAAADVQAARDAVGKATAEGRAAAEQALADAEKSLADATKAVAEFDGRAAQAARERQVAEEKLRLEHELEIQRNREAAHWASLSLEQQVAAVDQVLRTTEAFTDSWVQAVQVREELLTAITQRQRTLQDNMHEAGVISDLEYLKLLDRRIAKETEYSDAWMALQRQRVGMLQEIARAEQDARDAELDRARTAVDALTGVYERAQQRFAQQQDDLADLWMRAAAEAKQQADAYAQALADRDKKVAAEVARFRDSIAQPVKDAGDLLANFGTSSWNPNADELTAFLDYRLDAVKRFQTALEKLATGGLNSDLVNRIAQAGPESLGLAETLAGMDPQAINDRISQVGGVGDALGQLFGLREQANITAKVAAEDPLPAMQSFNDLLAQEVSNQQAAAAQRQEAEAWARGMIDGVYPDLNAGQRTFDDLLADEIAKQADSDASHVRARDWAVDMVENIYPSLNLSSQEHTRLVNDETTAVWALVAALRAAREEASKGGAAGSSLRAGPEGPSNPFGYKTASFDVGGYLQPGWTLAYNGTGRPEPVGGASVVVQSGAVQVAVSFGGAAGGVELAQVRSEVAAGVQDALDRVLVGVTHGKRG